MHSPTITPEASRILDFLTAELDVDESRKFDVGTKLFMPAVVQRLEERLYSVTHYYESCGDLVADPDMTFWKSPLGSWLPVSFEMPGLGYRQIAVTFGEDGTPDRADLDVVGELSDFANEWMVNIRDQQSLDIPPEGEAPRACPGSER